MEPARPNAVERRWPEPDLWTVGGYPTSEGLLQYGR